MKIPFFDINSKISNRISLGYVIVIAVAIVSSVTCIMSLRNNRKIDAEITEIQLPAIAIAKDFRLMAEDSKRLTNNWIFLPTELEKKRLRTVMEKDFPELENRVERLNEKSASSGHQKEFSDEMFSEFESIMISEKQVMSLLPIDTAYANDSLFKAATEVYILKVLPKIEKLDGQLAELIETKNQYLDSLNVAKSESSSRLSYLMVIVLILILIVGVGASYFSTRGIINPVNQLKELIMSVGKGEIMRVEEKLVQRKDEIGQMSNAIDAMIIGLQSKVDFADEIGKGNYDKEFHLLSDKDTMGYALLEMRENLKKNAEEEGKRSWVTTGLAKIGEILRNNTISASELYNEIMSFIIKYVGANQGGIYILNDEQADNLSLDMVACFAYDKKRFVSKQIGLGEGMVGQCLREKLTIHMTNIPEDYVYITSGLGQSKPTSILITPLKINEDAYGVLELASFYKFEKHVIEFVEKISESIASTVSSVKINEQTKKLLGSSQEQSEELKSQEEEMRQNMEEMSATQEEMQRKEAEIYKILDETKENEQILKQKAEEYLVENKNLKAQIFALIEENKKKDKNIHELKSKLNL